MTHPGADKCWKAWDKYATPNFPLPLNWQLSVKQGALTFTRVISVRASCREGHPSTLKGSHKVKIWTLPQYECQVLTINKNNLEILSIRTIQSPKYLYYDCHRQELIYLLFSSTFLSLTCIFCSLNIGWNYFKKKPWTLNTCINHPLTLLKWKRQYLSGLAQKSEFIGQICSCSFAGGYEGQLCSK